MKFFGCRRFAGIFLLFVLTCGGCMSDSENTQKKPITSISQLNDPAYTIASYGAGTMFEAVKRDLPKAKSIYMGEQQAYKAVQTGKVDAYADLRTSMKTAIAEGLKGVRLLPGSIGEKAPIAVGISRTSKIPDLKGKINTFIAELKANGTLQEMHKRWTTGNHTMPDIPVPEKADTIIEVGTTGLVMPFSYYEGNTLTGYDVELARRFAKWLGAELEFKVYNFEGAVAAAAAGDVDCVMSNLNVTPERAEKIDFSDVIYMEEIALMVKDDAPVPESEASAEKGYHSIAELDGKRIGVSTGTVHDQAVEEVLPNAQHVYFDVLANALISLALGKIDAFVHDEFIILAIEQENPSFRHLDGYLQSFDTAFIVSPSPEGDKIRTQFNEFIRSLKADGTLKNLRSIWFGTDESRKLLPEYEKYPDTNGTLRIAAENEAVPFTYVKDNRLVGYEIDIIARFCKAYGYRPAIEAVNFPSIIPGVKSGKYMIGVSSFSITEERKESVNFTEPTYTGGVMALVRKLPEELKADTSSEGYSKIADLNGKRIGVLTGSIGGEILKGTLPAAKVFYLDNYADMSNSLSIGKIDAILEDDFVVFGLEHENPNFKHIDGYLRTFDKAFIFTKSPEGDKIRTQFNEFVRTMKADGTLKKISDVWLGFDENAKTLPDYESYPDTNGTIKFAVDSTTPTFSYVKDGKIVGYDVDILTRFCKAYGYRPEPAAMNFSGELPAVNSGKCLVGISAIAITPERAETVNFSEPVYTGGAMLLVKKSPEELRASQSNTPSVLPTPAKYTKFADLRGKKIGALAGMLTNLRSTVLQRIPDAQIVYYNTIIDLISALEAGKIEAFIQLDMTLSQLTANKKNIAVLDEPIAEGRQQCAVFSRNEKGAKLRSQFNEYITAMKNDGRMKALFDKWTGADESAKTVPDYESLPAPNGVITLATDGKYPPMSYYNGNQLTGLELDLASGFCKAYGYGLKINVLSYGGFLPSVKSGKSDFAVSANELTDERAESFLFSEPYYGYTFQLAVLASQKGTPAPAEKTANGKYTSLAELRGKKIGIQTGVDSWARLVKKFIPDAEVLFFNDITSLASALESGKIDAFLESNIAMAMLMSVKKNITVLDETIPEAYSTAVSLRKDEKGKKLKAQWDEYITALKKDGKIDALMDKWTGADESAKTLPDYEAFPAPNGVLVLATDGDYPPMSYYSGNTLTGFEIDLAARFCEAYGYGLKFQMMSYSGILPSIAAGKCDFSVSAASVSEEHKETLTLSVPYYTYTTKIAVLVSETDTTAPAVNTSDKKYTGLADLNGKRIGVPTGVDEWTVIINKLLPDAEPVYYNSTADLIAALEGGKIEAFPCDAPVLDVIMSQNKNIAALDENFQQGYEAGVAFPKTEKGRKLKAQWDEYITSLKNTGKLEDLVRKWTGSDESAKTIPNYESFSAPNGVLTTAATGDYPPFCYFKNNKLHGLEVDLAAGFCQIYGYGLKYRVMAYDGIFPGLQSGKSDFVLAALSLTDEHAESLLFSIPYYTFTTKIAVLASKKGTSASAMNVQPANTPPAKASNGKYTSLADLNGKRIGVPTGVDEWAKLVHILLPDSEVVYYNEWADMAAAMASGKIAAFLCDTPVLNMLMQENKNIASLGVNITESFDVAVAFNKSDKSLKLKAQWDEYITAIKASGELDAIIGKWTGAENPENTAVNYSSLPATNGVLVMAADSTNPPFDYHIGNKLAGFEIELAVKFCEAYGYGLSIKEMAYDAVLAALRSGKCDFALADLVSTEEHAENVLFSVPYYASATAVAIPADKAPSKTPSAPAPHGRYNSLEDLAGKKIGVMTGTTNERLVAESIPTAERVYFNNLPDALLALKTGKIDAICCSVYAARYMMIENDDITYLENMLIALDLAPIFSPTEKGRKLREEYSEFLKGLWADGTIQKIDSIWLGKDESKRVIKDYSKLPAPNGVLKMASEPTDIPFVYMKDNRFVGYDVDIAVRFCESHGYGLEVVPMNFPAVISSVNSGKTDFSASMHWNPERAKSALFASVPTAHSGNVLVVMKAQDAPAEETHSTEGEYSTFEELAGKTVGVQTGTLNDQFTLKVIPTAKVEYFDTIADIVTALKMRKIDAGAIALNVARFMMIDNDDELAWLSQSSPEVDAAPIFAKTDKGRKLCAQFNEFIKAQRENGYIQELHSIWFGRDDSKRKPTDYASLPATNGKLRMAVDISLYAPFAYVKDNKIVGYEIDFAAKFCKEYGYGLEVIPMNFGAIIAAVQSGKCDFASCTIAITPERAEQVLFASPNAKTGCALVVRKATPKPVTVQPKTETPSPSPSQSSPQTQASPSQTSAFMEDARVFFEELKASFNRTFIREERWRLFIEGIINTMIITVVSIVFGTILGFVVYLLCRGGNVFANLLTRFFIWLIEGTPMVVLLMILYYIIFGKVDIPGIWVAVIAFTLTFGAGFFGMLKSGTGALDRGQTEAAYALGFSDTQTFFTVILPQAALHFMPAYKSSVVALIKSTAIVGYIAVQDLTKMGDIVRSRTYEAFFPLIAVAAIYFVLAGMLNIIVGMIHNRIRPEKRTKDDILRGIDSHD